MPTNIPYQPIQFNLSDDLVKPDIFRQLIHEDDKLNFQIKADIDSLNLIFSGIGNYLQDPAAQWVDSGGLFKVLGNDGRIYQDALTLGNYYRVIVNILELNTNGEVEISLGTNTIATITNEGEHILSGECVGNTEFSIYADANTEVTIEDNVEGRTLIDSIYVGAIADNLTTQVGVENITTIVADSPSFIKDDIAVFKDLDLPENTTLVPGVDLYKCFRLVIGNRGDIEFQENWSSPIGWTFQELFVDANSLRGVDITGSSFAEKDITLPNDSYVIISIEVFTVQNVQYLVHIEDENGDTIYNSMSRTETGTFLDIAYLPAQTTDNFTFIFRAFPTDPTNLIEVDDFFIYSLDNHLISNPFKKVENNEGTLLLEGSNDSDCFGFTFENDFQFNLRFNGDLQMYLPEDEAEIYKDSRGVKKLYYAESEETQQIAFDSAPIYIVRALQKMRLLNTVLLDVVEKTLFDNDFDLESDSEKMNTGAFLVTDKIQNYFNYL